MPTQDYFKCKLALDKLANCGILSTYLDEFTDWLTKQGFHPGTLQVHVSNIAHFSHSLKEVSSPSIQRLSEYFDDFIKEHVPNCACKGWKRKGRVDQLSYSFSRFKKFLRNCYGLSFERFNTAYAEIHKEYLVWLSERKLKADSIKRFSGELKKFLEWYAMEYAMDDLRELKRKEVECFFLENTRERSRTYKRAMQSTLRSFFDFCHEKEYTSQNLRYALPVIKTYRLSDVPKGIAKEEAEKLLKSIDRTNASGIRAYAVLLLLYTYGVRGCQIRALKLKDINWDKEEINFPALKNGKNVPVPLTVEVGNALLDYLRNVRRETEYEEVFLTLKAPVRPVQSNCLRTMVTKEMLTAGIKSPVKGSRCFRHCFVSRMLAQGESFKHIADFMGHKAIESTFIYTKIDFNALANVALELPEVKDENN